MSHVKMAIGVSNTPCALEMVADPHASAQTPHKLFYSDAVLPLISNQCSTMTMSSSEELPVEYLCFRK